MAGHALQDPFIGVGPALRRAREMRRMRLDEASRDTKLSVDHLRALEEERFDELLGDVYVRGSLRTYAQYLGLSPDKVAAAYARYADEPEPPPPPAGLGRVERAIAATRIRDNQRLMVVVAVTLLVVALALGLLSRGASSPAPANLASAPAVAPPLGRSVDIEVVALHDAQVTVAIDGDPPKTYALREGETREFTGENSVVFQIARGGTVQVTVNGNDLGAPGRHGKPWKKTFSFTDPNGEGSPSPSA